MFLTKMTTKNNNRYQGFTLIELMLTVAIIALIVTMVYGSFAALCRSAKKCNKGAKLYQNMQKTLTLISEQIRCCYYDRNEQFKTQQDNADATKAVLSEPINFFYGNDDDRKGIVLKFITTKSLDADLPGIFESAYKYDHTTGTLFINQKPFHPSKGFVPNHNDWLKVADAIEAMDIRYYDGTDWVDTWNYTDKKTPPSSVHIIFDIKNNHGQIRKFETKCNVITHKNKSQIKTKAKPLS